MYDPMTVAFEIKWPFKRKKRKYRDSFITIWHVDPELYGDDDSCGWTFPPEDKATREKVIALAKDQYGNIFARQVAYNEGKTYFEICYDQDVYGMIYWSWRALKAMGKSGWQYGKLLSIKELDEIYKLATNPVDNFQSHKRIRNYEDFERFFLLIWRVFRRFYRPWYRHPRWHLHHWHIQFHPWQKFKRRYIQRCDKCGKRGFTGPAYSDWDGTRIWCEKCEMASNVQFTQK